MSEDAAPRTMHIGELAERTGLSLRSIRHYDDVGLLPPSARSEGGFRVYTEVDHDRLRHIMRMKPMGFSLDEIAELLPIVEGEQTASAEQLNDYRARAAHKRAKLATYLAQADELVAQLDALAGK